MANNSFNPTGFSAGVQNPTGLLNRRETMNAKQEVAQGVTPLASSPRLLRR